MNPCWIQNVVYYFIVALRVDKQGLKLSSRRIIRLARARRTGRILTIPCHCLSCFPEQNAGDEVAVHTTSPRCRPVFSNSILQLFVYSSVFIVTAYSSCHTGKRKNKLPYIYNAAISMTVDIGHHRVKSILRQCTYHRSELDRRAHRTRMQNMFRVPHSE